MVIKNRKPDIRYLNDMRKVVYDKKWLKNAPNLEVYYMYRGVKIENGIKQNITIFPPLMLGKEFTKTKGHEHKGNYGEVYKVIEGKAIFLLQKRKPASKKIRDVYAVKANKNEVVIIPSVYGHITINPTNKILKTRDWSCNHCKSDYSFFERMGGACYYYTKSGWIRNKNYKKVPKLRFEKPQKKIPNNLNFLK
jgi:glucose-6-phosphate isomerase